MAGLLILIATFGLMWALLIRPQQKKAQAHRALVAALAVGDEVMTTSGIYGTLVEIEEAGDIVWLEVAEGIELKLARGAIARQVTPAEASQTRDDDTDLDDELDQDVIDADVVDEVEAAELEAGPTEGAPPAHPDAPGSDR